MPSSGLATAYSMLLRVARRNALARSGLAFSQSSLAASWKIGVLGTPCSIAGRNSGVCLPAVTISVPSALVMPVMALTLFWSSNGTVSSAAATIVMSSRVSLASASIMVSCALVQASLYMPTVFPFRSATRDLVALCGDDSPIVAAAIARDRRHRRLLLLGEDDIHDGSEGKLGRAGAEILHGVGDGRRRDDLEFDAFLGIEPFLGSEHPGNPEAVRNRPFLDKGELGEISAPNARLLPSPRPAAATMPAIMERRLSFMIRFLRLLWADFEPVQNSLSILPSDADFAIADLNVFEDDGLLNRFIIFSIEV